MQDREAGWLLLAEIEEAESGDQGRVRQWLSRAVKAPRDPAWTADGFVSDKWGPASPVTGRLNAFEWKVPVERLGPAIEAASISDDEIPARKMPSATPTPFAAGKSEEAVHVADAEIVSVKESPIPPPETWEVPASKPAVPELAAVASNSTAKDEEVAFPVPDDPGVAPDKKVEKELGRFRLF